MWLYHRVMSLNDADGMANSVDPDQTAPLGAVWSGSALFAQAYLSENLGLLRYIQFFFLCMHIMTCNFSVFQLIDCYMEAYHHVFDRDEKRAIAQVVMNIIYQRPRFDLTADYFIKMYRAECVILRQHVNLIKGILDKQVNVNSNAFANITQHLIR